MRHQWASDIEFDGIRLEVLSDEGSVIFDISVPENGEITINTFGGEVPVQLVKSAMEIIERRHP